MGHPQHRPRPECWSCIMDISLEALSRTAVDEKAKFEIMSEVAGTLSEDLREDSNLPAISTRLFRWISERTGKRDLFAEEKGECNRIALPIALRLGSDILKVKDPQERLRSAALAAIAGNTMDLGTSGHSFDLATFEEDYRRTVDQGLAIDDTADLLQLLRGCGDVIYLADNAGEIAFDRILVQVISSVGPEVTVAVKGGPISNDATTDDAEYVKMGELARIITTGTDHLGVNFEESSAEFRAAFDAADIVISKGQSNLETLSYESDRLAPPVAYILKAKCAPIARALGADVGDNVLLLAGPG
jgi:uncharacterized protein with ATP-grasp and redox domains